MKKIMSFMIITVLLLSGCGNDSITTGDMYDQLPINDGDDSNTSQMVDDAYFLNGELKEIGEGSVLIDTEEAGLVWVSLEDEIDLAVTVKSIVRVQFDGAIAESYPGQARGRSLEVIEPFLDNPVHSFEEMTAKFENNEHFPVVVWNNVKDTVAYVMVVQDDQLDSYQVHVASLYQEESMVVAVVRGEVPDLNWFYDRLEVQTSSGSMEYGPEFEGIKPPDRIEDEKVDGHTPVEVVYNLVNQVYEDQETNVSIEYFQVAGMIGELVQDYVNQSLKHIVDIYGEGYTDTVITARILRQDDFLTIAYEGYNEAASYEIQKFMTIDMMTSTELTVDEIIADMATFESMFKEASGYDYETLEGVSVYMDEDAFIFTFVPTDDSAEREFIKFQILELAPILDMDFEMPAS